MDLFNIGKDFTLATGDMIIPFFPDQVQQFIIAKTTPVRHAAFFKELKAKSDKSIPLFHGTPVANVCSILRVGFRPDHLGNGLFMAEEPSTSYYFANNKGIPLNTKSWKNTPYRN
jgi:hypothetical protein